VLAARPDEGGDLLDRQHARTAAAELRLAFAERQLVVPLLAAVDDR